MEKPICSRVLELCFSMMYDTHCHPYLAKEKSQNLILENFFWSGWEYLNCIAVDIQSSRVSIDLSKKYSGVQAVIWIHPTHCLEYKWALEKTIEDLELLYKTHSQHIVAIGECWLDYHWLQSLSEKYALPKQEIITIQKEFFKAQINLAKKLKLPIVIHNRNASEDVFLLLQESWFKNFVFHCFSEGYDFAMKLINFAPECKLWFWGIVTFNSALKIQEAAAKIPLKNILVETDSPYLTPAPHRGKQENEPLYVRHVLDKIIDLRDESPEEIEREIFENSKKLFTKK